jgi:hypothetical protein
MQLTRWRTGPGESVVVLLSITCCSLCLSAASPWCRSLCVRGGCGLWPVARTLLLADRSAADASALSIPGLVADFSSSTFSCPCSQPQVAPRQGALDDEGQAPERQVAAADGAQLARHLRRCVAAVFLFMASLCCRLLPPAVLQPVLLATSLPRRCSVGTVSPSPRSSACTHSRSPPVLQTRTCCTRRRRKPTRTSQRSVRADRTASALSAHRWCQFVLLLAGVSIWRSRCACCCRAGAASALCASWCAACVLSAAVLFCSAHILRLPPCRARYCFVVLLLRLTVAAVASNDRR